MEEKPKTNKKLASDSNKRIEKLLAENLEQNKEILETVKSTRRYIKFIRIVNVVKALLIIVPLALALIYVPPFLQKILSIYDELLGTSPFEILQDIKNGE
jgi:hypothetical protein